MLSWTLMVFILIWLLIGITVMQIGNNICRNSIGQKKIWSLIGTFIIDSIWTISVLYIYKLVNLKLPYLFKFINGFLNLVWKFLPKQIIAWILIPTIISYVILGVVGIFTYWKKYHQYQAVKIQKMKKELKGAPQMSSELREKLDKLSEGNNAKTALIFRKLIRKANRNQSSLFVIKQNKNFWVPIFNERQQKELDNYIEFANVSWKNSSYPVIVKIAQTNVGLFDLKDGQVAFKESLTKGED